MEQFLKQIMVICFILIFILAVGTLIYSEAKADDHEYLQQSPIDPRKEVIHDADGDAKGYLQKSPIDPRKTVQYDKNGNVKGTWQKSYIDPRKRIYTPKKK